MKDKYLNDIAEIKAIMNKSKKFTKLSGLSGISTGVIALLGLWLAFIEVFKTNEILIFNSVLLPTSTVLKFIIIACSTLLLSIISACYFSYQQLKKQNEIVWSLHTKKFLINFLFPMLTGGIICLIFLQNGFIGFLPALTLIFYGLSLINASSYTIIEIEVLGYCQVVLGVIAFLFLPFSLWFWGIGFGVLQIITGIVVHKKYIP